MSDTLKIDNQFVYQFNLFDIFFGGGIVFTVHRDNLWSISC